MSTSLLRTSSSTSLLGHLIDSPTLVREVRALPPVAFSKLIQRVGVEDAGELVALATTEQLVSAFDEDLFRNDRPGTREAFDPGRFVTWLEVLLEAGEDIAARRFAELSEDFVTHAIDSLVLVLDSEALRSSMDEGGDDAVLVDKSLESAVSEEIDGYLLVARSPDGWDAIYALILALDRDHRALLERILDRCANISRELVDDLEALSTVLSEGASLADDVEGEREDRRNRVGFVEPRAARAFLELARTGKGDGKRDPNTKAHFRGLGMLGAQPDPGSDAARLVHLLEQPEEEAPRRPSLPRPDAIVEALQLLREHDATAFEERMAELAYLANVLVAGGTVEGRRYRTAEAAEAAMATVARGAELEHRKHSKSAKRPTAESLAEILLDHPADLLFRSADGVPAQIGS